MSTIHARLFVISGPSGAGKGTLVSCIRQRITHLDLTVSVTTRAPRSDESDGVAYHFVDDATFDSLVEEGAFLEWASVHNHRYGTLKSEVNRSIDAGHSVVLEIDVQGALNVRKECPHAVLIFIEPPSLTELELRLRSRGTESEAEIATRLNNAKQELELASQYDERILNDDLNRATTELVHLIEQYETNGG